MQMYIIAWHFVDNAIAGMLRIEKFDHLIK